MIREDLLKIFKNSFENIPESVLLSDFSELKMGVFDEWDSLGNLNFLLEVESHFNLRFNDEQLTSVQSLLEVEKFIISSLQGDSP